MKISEKLIEIGERLREHKEYILVYHVRPDGDCIGSAYALCLALQSIGAKCRVVGNDVVPVIHRELTDKVVMDELTNPKYISIDTVSNYRLGIYGKEEYYVCIDHHRDNSINAAYKYVEEDCGACSEIIYKLIKSMNIEFTKDMVNLLYTALVTDTMCFRTSDTNEQTFETALELTRLGADTHRIAMKNSFVKSKKRIAIEERLKKSFNYTCDGKVLTGIITMKDLLEENVLDSELEGINSVVQEIEGVKIGATLRELEDGRIRCSMRTAEEISANDICMEHGGGGHLHAACCEFELSAEEARKLIEETCKKYV